MSSTTSSWRPVVEEGARSPKRPLSRSNVSFTLPAPKKARIRYHPQTLVGDGTTRSAPMSDAHSSMKLNHPTEDPVPSLPSPVSIMPAPARTMAPSRHQDLPLPPSPVPEDHSSTVLESQARTAPATQKEAFAKTIPVPLQSTMTVVTPPSSHSVGSQDSTTESSLSTGVTTPIMVTKRILFDNLPSEVADRILEFTFVRETTVVKPFYRKGMLAGSIRTGNDIRSQETGDEVLLDNVDLGLMRISKQFRDAGCRYFYGTHTFCFHDPSACKWWFKTIGSDNVSSVRSLSLRMGSGFTVFPADVRCSLDLTLEEQWHQFFCWIKNRHNLTKLRIEFYHWSPIEERDLHNHWKQLTHAARTKLLAKMRCIRGVEQVEVFDHTGHYMNAHGCRLLELQLMQEEDRNVFHPDQRKKPLSQVMEELRASRVREEAKQQTHAAALAEMQERRRPVQSRQTLGVSNTRASSQQIAYDRAPASTQANCRPAWYSRVPGRATGPADVSANERFLGRTARPGVRPTYSKKKNNRSGWSSRFDLDL
ncbi:hypothetical protein LTR10_012576 [Elasticomyces elasticus]|uniref:F-box domain-containing protein n=1 Tax=Exophiala sideris TaxID=1016849 RepID=A0ABR0JRL8_9EURO|nr:hypothetical protein LTR10_012576 [Elasticomyces elasticus]KAK5040223.1 hypothetical protein LTS07_000720 [Exophiala sideris]KAK5043351.1 hypothetical protein LTR13_001122 [Exophiala sideris]KAK5068601.1 hypothetical protein LTR69_000721 [Exophiala sideris]KAK5186199.1 hypothetical protein LTR44_001254 [Eurotiomycetes sp. CCFEE 6388]